MFTRKLLYTVSAIVILVRHFPHGHDFTVNRAATPPAFASGRHTRSPPGSWIEDVRARAGRQP